MRRMAFPAKPSTGRDVTTGTTSAATSMVAASRYGVRRKIHELVATLPDGISTPELKVEAPDGNPHAFVDRFKLAAKFEGARLSTMDGLRVDWPDGWGLVRASNTTPILVMRFDADTNAGMARIQQAFREQLHQVEPDLRLPF